MSNHFSVIAQMATEAMRQIIQAAAFDEDIRIALNDIRGFTFQTITRCTRDLLQEVEDAGFQFQSTGITGRKEELKSFLRAHPECMSADIETIIDKISIFSDVQSEVRRQEREKQLQRIRSRKAQRQQQKVQTLRKEENNEDIGEEEEDKKE